MQLTQHLFKSFVRSHRTCENKKINLGTDKNKNILLTSPLHPMMKRAFTILEPLFIEHIIPESGHSILAAEENWEVLLDSIPDCAERVKENLKKKWKNSRLNPAEKWEELKQHLDVYITKTAGGGKTQKTMTSAEKNKLQTWPIETVFRYTYPRLDINVSKMQNHLLKSPFCVHPKTSRVCIPIQVDKVDAFDPFSVPTLSDLIDELNTAEKSGTTKVTHGWQKTSLKESFEPFIKNFLEPLWKDIRKQKRDYAEESAAFSGEF
jgi:DNA primase small subunit